MEKSLKENGFSLTEPISKENLQRISQMELEFGISQMGTL